MIVLDCGAGFCVESYSGVPQHISGTRICTAYGRGCACPILLCSAFGARASVCRGYTPGPHQRPQDHLQLPLHGHQHHPGRRTGNRHGLPTHGQIDQLLLHDFEKVLQGTRGRRYSRSRPGKTLRLCIWRVENKLHKVCTFILKEPDGLPSLLVSDIASVLVEPDIVLPAFD